MGLAKELSPVFTPTKLVARTIRGRLLALNEPTNHPVLSWSRRALSLKRTALPPLATTRASSVTLVGLT
ncbi:hypothetical protein ABIF65_011988 [Bradyrhizobium japonicum]|nr:hypothetical protein [Bradyrhizobium japonicum]MCP1748594.1 hypothetical protein [Bradyrhizobium japonicum]MCP1769070.1 hypothetical protein [Bradyrhizobium japonicum]MCP1780770.1 hypothetical protein [Bradyrhizobium japonicum]MCP1784776.1 hypothetical protein [Bradyrhizobium japonicum]